MPNSSSASKTQDSANLTTLAATVRAGLAAIAHAEGQKLTHALTIGDALAAAKVLAGHGGWLLWLETCGGLSARSARDYMRLAAHRPQIEAYRQHAADLTIRGTLRLIGGGAVMRKRHPPPALRSAIWHAASIRDRTAFVYDIPLVEWLEVIPASWRIEIANRVDGLRAARAKSIAAVAMH
jgi:Protein of unknown function (DUF3102)